jgi:ribonuclease HII
VPEHLAALDRLGPTRHHRRLFAPVAAAWDKHAPGERVVAVPPPDLFDLTALA